MLTFLAKVADVLTLMIRPLEDIMRGALNADVTGNPSAFGCVNTMAPADALC